MKLKKKKSNESYQTEESKRENKAEGRHVIAAKRAKKKKEWNFRRMCKRAYSTGKE